MDIRGRLQLFISKEHILTRAQQTPITLTQANPVNTGLFEMIVGVLTPRSPDAIPCDFFLWGYVSGFRGLMVNMLASGTNPAEAVGFFERKNPQHAFLRWGSKAVCPTLQICGM
jgi:hypothetical protein